VAAARPRGTPRRVQDRFPGLDPGGDPGAGKARVPGRDRSHRGCRVTRSARCRPSRGWGPAGRGAPMMNPRGGSTMPFSTIATPEAKPVANYKMATRMEGGRLLYISGQVAWDAAGNIVGKGDIRAQAKQVFENLRGVLR